MFWTDLGPVGRSDETGAAGSNARFENHAIQNQQISVQNATRELSRFRNFRQVTTTPLEDGFDAQ
jgi:hypothetical protein